MGNLVVKEVTLYVSPKKMAQLATRRDKMVAHRAAQGKGRSRGIGQFDNPPDADHTEYYKTLARHGECSGDDLEEFCRSLKQASGLLPAGVVLVRNKPHGLEVRLTIRDSAERFSKFEGSPAAFRERFASA